METLFSNWLQVMNIIEIPILAGSLNYFSGHWQNVYPNPTFFMESHTYLPAEAVKESVRCEAKSVSSPKYMPREGGQFWWHIYLMLTDISEKTGFKRTDPLNEAPKPVYQIHPGAFISLFVKCLKYSFLLFCGFICNVKTTNDNLWWK